MKNKRINLRFRKQLKGELPTLQTGGLISADQSEAISRYYGLDGLAGEAMSKLLMVIYLVGVTLVGVGVISFVAYHWSGIGRAPKIALIFAAMAASHGAGFYLWQVSGKSVKLGHALIVLGTLIFGANIGLMAQIFHVKGQWNNMFIMWAVGAAVVAYAVGSVPNAVIAIVTSFVWFVGQYEWWYYSENIWWYPLAVIAVFGGFAYWRRSVFLFGLTAVCVGISLPMSLSRADTFGVFEGMLIAGALSFVCGVLCRKSERVGNFMTTGVVLGVGIVAFVLYFCSFGEIAGEVAGDIGNFFTKGTGIMIAGIVPLVASLAMVPLAIKRMADSRVLKLLAIPVIGGAVIVALAAITHELVLMVIANVLFLFLSAVLIWGARTLEDRRLFWCGVLMTAAYVLGRTFEYETGLLLKAAAFVMCGVGVIVAGVMYEKNLKKRRITDE